MAVAQWPRKDFEEADWKALPISFSDADLVGVITPQSEALVTEMRIGDYDVEKVLFDTGSGPDVLYYHTYERMKLDPALLRPHSFNLYGFNNIPIGVEGVVTLPVMAGKGSSSLMVSVDFLVVKVEASYNAILGRPFLSSIKGVVSQPHLCIKFPTPGGVGIIRGDQQAAKQCYYLGYKKQDDGSFLRKDTSYEEPADVGECRKSFYVGQRESHPMESLDCTLEDSERTAEAGEPTLEVVLADHDPSRTVKIGAALTDEERVPLVDCLRAHADVFSWETSDMAGIHPGTAVHRIPTSALSKPVLQKVWPMSDFKKEIVDKEVQKLHRAGFVQEVTWPRWISNPVVVPKGNDKWRMCVDYRILNKACSKDCYPVPNIHELVERAIGHGMMSFLDANAGYHQIPVAKEDQDKTSFYAGGKTWCFVRMPFGLKNAGATYQRFVHKIFGELIGKFVEVYVDDMLVKSLASRDHIGHLEQVFDVLRVHGLKLNPHKCAFGVRSGKFLGYMVSKEGIRANPEKILAVESLTPPTTVKEVQKLTGMVAALNRFIARAADKCLPFFKILKNVENFVWTDECQVAFDALKTYLSSAPLLSAPIVGESLYVYLGVTDEAMSAVLIREDKGKQRPVYYVSSTLKGAELNYSVVEKTAFAVLMAARKLKTYFQAHPIVVLTNQPLRQILQKPETSGRLLKWTIELSEYDITYMPRPAIKAQALADFIVETTETVASPVKEDHSWDLFVDGSACGSGAGAGVLLLGPSNFRCEYALRFGFKATNNRAEYEALILGLKVAAELQVKELNVYSDSQLVVNQVNGAAVAKDEEMKEYLALALKLMGKFEKCIISKVPRTENGHADALARLASAAAPEQTKSVFVETLEVPSTRAVRIMTSRIERRPPCWMDDLVAYLSGNYRVTDREAAVKLRRKAARYALIEGQLYKRSLTLPWMRCLTPAEAQKAMSLAHEGEGAGHPGSQTLTRNLMRQGFYWPTMIHDTESFVKRCDKCQRHGRVIRQPAEELHSIVAPWPFAQWGIDIVGPFKTAPGGNKFLVVATDYFSKWVEAEPLVHITAQQMRAFVWQNIVCRYGIPNAIVTDNGAQFTAAEFQKYCEEQGIKIKYASVENPQCNGQAEATNKTLVDSIKKRLDEAKGRWVEELYHALWAHRTTFKVATGQTPYHLVFGCEAVVPAEMELRSARINTYAPAENEEQMRLRVDMIAEVRENAHMRNLEYKRRCERFYNQNVKFRKFEVGDKVMLLAGARKNRDHGKLASTWEGPYYVREVIPGGAYRLTYMSGVEIQNTWNARFLKNYFE